MDSAPVFASAGEALDVAFAALGYLAGADAQPAEQSDQSDDEMEDGEMDGAEMSDDDMSDDSDEHSEETQPGDQCDHPAPVRAGACRLGG